ncbi:polysaccharide export protein [bacterium]|nr:polysaccharide export protein [bacterium]
MHPKRVGSLLLLWVLLGFASLPWYGCGSPYYVEGQDELGDLPDSLRIVVAERDRAAEAREARRQKGVFVQDLTAGEDVVPLPLEYSSEGPYRLRRGDKVQVSVLFYPELETVSVVRPDGKITAPGLGDVAALGRAPEEVAADIQAYFSTLLRDPTTTLNVLAFGERNAYVFGQVQRPGPVNLQQRMTLTQAIAQTGSVTQDAKLGTVVLLRRKTENTARAYRLDLNGVLKGESLAADIVLQPDDVIWVPRTFLSSMDNFVHQVFSGLLPIPDLFIKSYDAIHVDERAALRRTDSNTTVVTEGGTTP